MSVGAHRVSQLKPGDQGFVRPVEASKGRKRQRKGSSSSPATFKVMHAEALVGMLLAMGSGASSAPKGGLTGMMEAALRGELQPEVSGKFGERAYYVYIVLRCTYVVGLALGPYNYIALT